MCVLSICVTAAATAAATPESTLYFTQIMLTYAKNDVYTHIHIDDVVTFRYVAKHATGALSGPIKINIKKKAPKPGDEEEDSTKKPAASMDMGFFGGLGAPAAAGAAAAPANPFATTPAPAAAAATAANPFAPAPAAAAPANPFAPAAAANPFAPAPAAAAPAADPFGAFQAAPASGGGSDWVKF